MNNRIWIVGLLLVSALTSCNSADEQDALAKAQKCLDEVPQSNPSAADECLQPIEKYTSQQAYILKCSIYMVSGGLMENKVLKGYKALKDDTIVNKEAAFMAVLSLDNPTLAAGLTKAQSANDFCQATGVPGLMYLSNIIVAGTAVAKTMSDFGQPIDINSTPAQINSALQAMLADCANTSAPTNAACDDNLTAIGTAVAGLSTTYCANKSQDDDVCGKVNDAVDAAGNNATNLGQALLCYMNNKTFNPSTGYCQ